MMSCRRIVKSQWAGHADVLADRLIFRNRQAFTLQGRHSRHPTIFYINMEKKNNYSSIPIHISLKYI